MSDTAPNPKLKCYIAGPMSGYAEFNFPAFFAAQELFESKGYEVFNPASKDNEANVQTDKSFAEGDDQKLMQSGWDFRAAFDWDCNKVIYADAIYMLKGWEKSSGARAEHAVAVSIQQRYPEYKIIYE